MIYSLKLLHYKNYGSGSFRFAPGLNVFAGRNGIGKTNLLDAIYYLCMARSHQTPQDKDTVQFEQPFFRLDGEVHANGNTHVVTIKVKPGSLKEISVDGEEMGKLSNYVGFIPVVMLAPEDVLLIQGGSATRRRFLDLILCQTDRQYLEHLQRYQKLLIQRNALLRNHGWNADRKLLMTYSDAMAEPAVAIHEGRALLVRELLPHVNRNYQRMSEGRETPHLTYVSQMSESTPVSLAKGSMESDLQTGNTTKGVHKDEVQVQLDQKPAKRFGSQGQVKSLLIALHLAQMDILRKRTGKSPVLLLDDIFDRLDEFRSARLVEILDTLEETQVFITDASPGKINVLLSNVGMQARVLTLQDNKKIARPKSGNLQDHEHEEE